MSPLKDAFKNGNKLAVLTNWKETAQTNAQNFRLENKLTTNDYGRITFKIP